MYQNYNNFLNNDFRLNIYFPGILRLNINFQNFFNVMKLFLKNCQRAPSAVRTRTCWKWLLRSKNFQLSEILSVEFRELVSSLSIHSSLKYFGKNSLKYFKFLYISFQLLLYRTRSSYLSWNKINLYSLAGMSLILSENFH